MDEQIFIPLEEGKLEGVFYNPLADNGKNKIKKNEKKVDGKGEQGCVKPIRGAIITHPHPEYGGNMHNGVVMTIEEAYRANGYATLRFNFRGTGQSRGRYDSLFDMCDDVVAAYRFMKDKGFNQIVLAGYSFGSWVNAHVNFDALGCFEAVAESKRATRSPEESIYEMPPHQLLVSPPVTFMDFSDVDHFACGSFVVYGDRDEFAALHALESHLKQWEVASSACIQGCDHFYSGKLGQLREALIDGIAKLSE